MPAISVNGPLCAGCPAQPTGVKLILPDGTGDSGIMFVGDSGWMVEAATGVPFSGPTGAYLNRILWRLGLERQQLCITNTTWCRAPRLDWYDHPERYLEAAEAIRHCRPYLDGLIAEKRPRVIVALGNVALRALCGMDGIEARHSYLHESSYGIPVIPTFHPSYIMQGKQKLTPAFMFAVRRAQEIAAGSYRRDDKGYRLLLDPTPDEARRYLAEAGPVIADLMVDIETPESSRLDEEELEEAGISYHIIRAGFSHSAGTGISFPWEQPYIGILGEAMSRARNIWEWAHNRFDSRRLRAAGLSWTGRVISGMWAWHWLQSDLLKGLGFVAPFFYAGPPFKHLSQENPPYYNAMDNCVGWACSLGSQAALEAEGRWSSFMRHCVDIHPIYVRMGEAGLRVNRDKQQAFMDRLRSEYTRLFNELQAEVPAKVRKLKTWVRRPKDMTDVREIAWTDGKPVKWERSLPFNPKSPPQTIELIKAMGLKPPKRKGDDGEDAETAQKKHLLRFAKKHPVFKKVVMYRERKDMVSRYNWPLDENSRVHTTLGFHPSTLRSSSRNVNLQIIPKRSDLAEGFRQMIEAAPGRMLVAGDSSAIEAVLVGYSAGSTRYINLAKAGVHAWLTSYIAPGETPIPYELPPDHLRGRCKEMKAKWPVLYEIAKRIVHMTNYLATPERIWEEYPDEFDVVKDARELQDVYLKSPAGVEIKAWHQRILQQAHRDNYLLNHFGYKHYFYEVFRWDRRRQRGKGDWVLGEDAKRAVAFIPQSDAIAIQREFELLLDADPIVGPLQRLVIHDEILTEPLDSEAEYAANKLREVMSMPIAELGGLEIGVEVKWGRNFGKWSAGNPDGMQVCEWEEVAA